MVLLDKEIDREYPIVEEGYDVDETDKPHVKEDVGEGIYGMFSLRVP